LGRSGCHQIIFFGGAIATPSASMSR